MVVFWEKLETEEEELDVARQSRGELTVESILRSAGLAYEKEYIFKDLVASSGRELRFDFAVFEDDGETVAFLIEYQGEQHYKAVGHFNGKQGLHRQQYNDRQKRLFCLEHNIPLVIIPYWDYDNLDYDYIINKANYL